MFQNEPDSGGVRVLCMQTSAVCVLSVENRFRDASSQDDEDAFANVARIFLRCVWSCWTLRLGVWQHGRFFGSRSIFSAVLHAEPRYPPRRLQLFLINSLWFSRSVKGDPNTSLFSACGFSAGFFFSFRQVPSELNYEDKGGRCSVQATTQAPSRALLSQESFSWRVGTCRGGFSVLGGARWP